MKQSEPIRNGSDSLPEAASRRKGPRLDLAVTLLTCEREFGALHAEWNALVASHPVSSVFLSHEWADAAWQWRRQDAALALLAVHGAKGELLGLAPLVRVQDRESGLRFRRLELLTVPDNQFADILFAPGYLPAVTTAIARWLKGNPGYWDQLTLRLLPAQSPTVAALANALEFAGLSLTRRNDEVNYAIDLTGTWEAYYRTRSRRLKKGNNLVANRLHRAGKVELTSLSGTEIDERISNAVRRLSAESWKQTTGTTLDQSGPHAFFERLVQLGRMQGWLSVWLLTLDAVPLAVELQVQHEGLVHGLRSDFREDLEALSPGTYLNWKIIEGLFGRGRKTYFLGPGENPYKRRWTTTGTQLARLNAWSPSARGHLLRILRHRLRPALRRSRDRLARMLNFAPISRISPPSQ